MIPHAYASGVSEHAANFAQLLNGSTSCHAALEGMLCKVQA